MMNTPTRPSFSRFKAGGLHFALSLSIFSVILWVLITLWYPEPFFSASGGWQGLKIVASIDVILGPLLTCIAFNPRKSLRALSLDLSVIATLQTAALVWGIHTIYQQRPVAVAFWDDSFLTVSAADLTPYHYPLSQLQQFSTSNPPFVYVEKPKDLKGLKRLLDKIIEDETAPHHQTDLYRPFDAHFKEIASKQLAIDTVLQTNTTLRPELEKLLHQSGLNLHDVQYFPLKTKYQDIILIFTPQGKLIGHLSA